MPSSVCNPDMLVYFQSEEDSNTAYAPKLAIVVGLTLTCLIVLMLPLDVANRSKGGGLPMELLWQIMYLAIAVMCIGVVPFMMFYYEAWDPDSRNWQVWTALKYEFVTVLVIGSTLVVMWLFLGYADVPVSLYTFNDTHSPTELLLPASTPVPDGCGALCSRWAEQVTLELSVTVPVYVMALVCHQPVESYPRGSRASGPRTPLAHIPDRRHPVHLLGSLPSWGGSYLPSL